MAENLTDAEREFEEWFSRNHPFDWFAAERNGQPLDGSDRLRVLAFAREAFLAAYARATERTARRCADICWERTKGLNGADWEATACAHKMIAWQRQNRP